MKNLSPEFFKQKSRKIRLQFVNFGEEAYKIPRIAPDEGLCWMCDQLGGRTEGEHQTGKGLRT